MTTELYEDPIRVGFQTKDYKAKPSYKSWKLRKDSALKLLKESDSWEIKRTRDRNAGSRATRSTDSKHYRGDEPEWESVDEEWIEHLEEKIYEYDYNISVNPENGKMEIWSNALGTWELRNPDFEATEGME